MNGLKRIWLYTEYIDTSLSESILIVFSFSLFHKTDLYPIYTPFRHLYTRMEFITNNMTFIEYEHLNYHQEQYVCNNYDAPLMGKAYVCICMFNTIALTTLLTFFVS